MSSLLAELRSSGCDIDGAMGRFLNNEEFYIRCFGKMLQDPAFDALRTALQEKNPEEAFLQAHTLKGVLANMGITPLYDIIVQIVEPLRQGNMPDELLQLYEKLVSEKEKYHQMAGLL